jgi:hypothetical protein
MTDEVRWEPSERPGGCQSAPKFDPAYCLICECYPDGALAAVIRFD